MPQKDHTPPLLKKSVQIIERYIIKTLIALMSILLVIATIELAYVLGKSIYETSEEHFIINLDNLMTVFGVFLLVVIGIELLDTIKVYFRKHVIHVEVVMLVAIIALARKVIVMDFDQYEGVESLGIAAIILALAGGYFLIKRTGGCDFWPKETGEEEYVIIEEKISRDDDRVLERKKIVRKKSEENLISGTDKQRAEQMKDPRIAERPKKRGDAPEKTE